MEAHDGTGRPGLRPSRDPGPSRALCSRHEGRSFCCHRRPRLLVKQQLCGDVGRQLAVGAGIQEAHDVRDSRSRPVQLEHPKGGGLLQAGPGGRAEWAAEHVACRLALGR